MPREVLDVRIPTFSRQTETPDTPADDRPTVAATPVRARRDDEPTTRDLGESKLPPMPAATSRYDEPPAPPAAVTKRTEADRATAVDDATTSRPVGNEPGVAEPGVRGPKPRASLLATLGLILGVVGALLVLSGPLLGYGIVVAAVALILSLAGIHATGKRHVAGKTDALIGMVLALGAIVVGVLALTGSLNWLGTDMQPVNSFRQWLDTQFVNRF
jgi:hypothetical protein